MIKERHEYTADKKSTCSLSCLQRKQVFVPD